MCERKLTRKELKREVKKQQKTIAVLEQRLDNYEHWYVVANRAGEYFADLLPTYFTDNETPSVSSGYIEPRGWRCLRWAAWQHELRYKE